MHDFRIILRPPTIPSRLALQWREIQWEEVVIRIRRTQEKATGRLIECTKTEAGTRAIPMGATLRSMLVEWKVGCPSTERVFPAPEGGTLLYSNFLHRIWKPALKRMGLPPVGIHSARASFISLLQVSGVDVATAARLAGHKNPAITLSHYAHSLRDPREAVESLDAVLP